MALKTGKSSPATAAKSDPKSGQSFPFTLEKEQYILILAGVALILVGAVLMSGGGTTDPNVFPKEELYSFRRITLAPIVILIGFVLPFVAILKRPASKQ